MSATLLLRIPHAAPSALQPPAGEEEPWPMYQRYPTHNAVFDQAGLNVRWTASTDGKINGGLAISNGTIYAASFDKKLYAINERTGAIRWTASADNILMSTPVVQDGVVIVGSGKDGFLKPDDYMSQVWGRPEGDDVYAFSTKDGHLAWKLHTVGQNMPSPAISQGAAIFANGDLHVYALELASGKQRWSVDTPGVATMASMNVSNGVAFVPTCHNAPYACETRAIDITDGRTLWTNRYGGSDCTPTVDDGMVFVNASRDEDTRFHTGGQITVAAIDERTGKTRWTYDAPPGPYTYIASAERQIAGVAHDGVLYQPIGNANRVVALKERTGKVLWTVHTSGNVKMSPVVKGEVVYFGDTAGVLYQIDRRNGHVIHTTSYLQPFSTSPPVIAGETMFIANGQAVLAVPLSDV
ncbi:MAG TPA: PQQ-binding-like beta-propeller repeat protein [Candidatus Baltobacteraceae bacterium]|nr:PQQ-binding-like beta-propeller repeat protein [Candidatus Baltobacteraceae bacterium]